MGIGGLPRPCASSKRRVTMTRLLARVPAILTTLALAVAAGPAFADQPRAGALGYQAPATPVMEGIEKFSNMALWPMCFGIVILVLALLLWCAFRYNHRANPTPSTFSHNTMLEVVWTGIPVLILVMIFVPSLKLLAFEAHVPNPDLTIKATGYQWYWGYDLCTKQNSVACKNPVFEFTANILDKDKAAAEGEPYMLATTQPLYVPVGKVVKMIVTGADVIHSWAVPSFGVKMDAIPGRYNVTWFKVNKPGVYYGECSELCGANHAFMPIEVHAVPEAQYQAWVQKMKQQFSEADPGKPVTVADNR
jgi:cytochrome c oxidase subunit 2